MMEVSHASAERNISSREKLLLGHAVNKLKYHRTCVRAASSAESRISEAEKDGLGVTVVYVGGT